MTTMRSVLPSQPELCSVISPSPFAPSRLIPSAGRSFDGYDEAEREALKTACYLAIRAFSPTHFHLNGFPTRVAHEDELRRYADIMGETTPRGDYLATHFYTPAEIKLMSVLSDRAFGLSGFRPLMCLLGPIPMVRHITKLAKGQSLMIMDVGAGSGYLSAYLALLGHRVIAVEVTQALYLWQSRFIGSSVRQVPWWEYAEMYRSPPEVDLVVCDAALAEMDIFACRYTMQLAKDMCGVLLHTSVGEQRQTNEFEIGQHAIRIGLELVKVIDEPIPDAGLRAGDFISFTPRMPSYDFADYIGIGR